MDGDLCFNARYIAAGVLDPVEPTQDEKEDTEQDNESMKEPEGYEDNDEDMVDQDVENDSDGESEILNIDESMAIDDAASVSEV